MPADPTLQEQESCWNAWNLSSRVEGSDTDEFCREVTRYVLGYVGLINPRPRSVIEVGCGTGWLSGAIHRAADGARVVGLDLSPKALAVARSRNPECSFVCGDFLGMELGDLAGAGSSAGYDLVVSVDAIAHVADQPLFVRRCRDLLGPGGRLLLVTQNPFVWHRTSWLPRQGKGQLRNWPSLATLRRLLADNTLSVERVTSLIPQGDRGVLRVRRYGQFALKLLAGRPAARAIQERLMLGRALVVEARRLPAA